MEIDTNDMEIDLPLKCTSCGIDMCHNQMCLKSRSDIYGTTDICKQCYNDYVYDFQSCDFIRALPCLYCGVATFRVR